jgi:aldose 1-epimerase
MRSISGFALALLSAMCLAGEATVKVKSEPFGKAGGKDVVLYTLENASGMKARIMTYGATLVSLDVPDKSGKAGDVTLGFDTVEGYMTKANPFFGATAGRYANRIAKGKFTLDGKTYTLATNNGENHLHGGVKGFDKVIWDAMPLPSNNAEQASVQFSYTSPDGEEGYPGTLKTVCTYTLNNRNELIISFYATTDKPTVLNLTNHSYWNLSGAAAGNILDHELTLYADKYVPVDKGSIPTGPLADVKGTIFDFTTPHTIGERIKQVGNDPLGYDHTWVLNGKAGDLKRCATVYDKTSGRLMDVLTTQPGVQFYTGNYLNGDAVARGNVKCNQHQGFCLETQHFPDSPNQPAYPTTVLRPGEEFRQITVHRFSVK